MLLIICLVVSLANAQKDKTIVLKPGQTYVAIDTAFVISDENMDTMLYVLQDYFLLKQENLTLYLLNAENQKIFVLKDSLLSICEDKNVSFQERLNMRDQRIGELKREKKWAYLKGALYGVVTFVVIESIFGR